MLDDSTRASYTRTVVKTSRSFDMYPLLWNLLPLLLAVFVLYAVYINIRFRSYGIPQPFEIPFLGLLGVNFLMREHMCSSIQQVYNFANKAKYMGCHMFASPVLMICDLDTIKSVLVKNFDNFAYRRTFTNDKSDPIFARSLVFANGKRWREIRNLLSPSFTSSKMRAMFMLMSNCAEGFADEFIKIYKDKSAIDMKDVLTRYANDVIATCAFGLEVNSLREPNNEFYVTGRKSTNFSDPITFIKLILMRFCATPLNFLGVRIVSKKDSDFFIKTIKSAIELREEKGITRPDMLQLMMDARGKTSESVDLDLLEITAQAFIFFLGGFETTSTHMCLICHELAVNPDIQEKLQNEIDQAIEECKGELTYEIINNLSYLEAVICEILRIHPALPVLSRVCNKEFELPPAQPNAKPYIVKPGTEVMVPVSAIHRNPEFYEDPDRFDPDRFLSKKASTSDVTNLGFGLGPRMCIGNRFAIMETKVLFVYLLSKCTLEPCEKTGIPLVYDPKIFSPSAKGGFWLRIKPRNKTVA